MTEWVSQWQGHLLSCSGQLESRPTVVTLSRCTEWKFKRWFCCSTRMAIWRAPDGVNRELYNDNADEDEREGRDSYRRSTAAHSHLPPAATYYIYTHTLIIIMMSRMTDTDNVLYRSIKLGFHAMSKNMAKKGIIRKKFPYWEEGETHVKNWNFSSSLNGIYIVYVNWIYIVYWAKLMMTLKQERPNIFSLKLDNFRFSAEPCRIFDILSLECSVASAWLISIKGHRYLLSNLALKVTLTGCQIGSIWFRER